MVRGEPYWQLPGEDGLDGVGDVDHRCGREGSWGNEDWRGWGMGEEEDGSKRLWGWNFGRDWGRFTRFTKGPADC